VNLPASPPAPPTTVWDYDFSNFYYGSGDDPLHLLEPFSRWYEEALPRGYDLYSAPLQSAPRTRIEIRNRRTGAIQHLVNVASYNYLGLSYRPEIKEAAARALDRYGLGASGSPILSGTFEPHVALARELAAFEDKPAALLFPTGYSANVGVIAGVMRAGDTVLLDQYAHASIVDGAVLSRARVVFFRHNNAADLDRKLRGVAGKKLVAVEGVYSMDGDLCPLPDIVAVTKAHGARLLIDEAHSTFLFGAGGRGVAEHFGLEDEIDFHVGTFSKALGGQGGFVCGSRALVDYLNAFGRSRFFSCNLSPVVTEGLRAALRIAAQTPALRQALWDNVHHLRERLVSAGVDVGATRSQIIPVMIRDDRRVFAVAEKLFDRGLFINPIVYPAVPKHRSRLRISVSAAHARDELDFAADTIIALLREEGLVR
jgi:8-amino-7-oxononanoate synthase